MDSDFSPPSLEPRFLIPSDWRWGFFTRENRTIRFGNINPKGKAAATVVCLTGLSEFSEKYFETARDLLAMDCAVWIMDWFGQGRSGRYLKNPHKRHSLGFEHDIADLHEFIAQHVRPNCGAEPLLLLAHSMGGHIGLHYLHDYPDMFKAAAFSAPMCAIKAVSAIPSPLISLASNTMNMLASESYVGGDGDWREDMRELKGFDPFSADPIRRSVHNAWCMADPRLQVGRVTYGWVHHAIQSCFSLQQKLRHNPLQTPCIIGLAGTESFVDNLTTRKIAGVSKTMHLFELPESRHEILMEQDATRSRFLEAFERMLEQATT